MKNFFLLLFSSLFLIIHDFSAIAKDGEENALDWPMEITTDAGYVVTLYQPQLDSFDQNILVGRMAVSVDPNEGDILFGAVWLKSKISTNLDERTVLLEDIEVKRTKFPESVSEDQIKKFSELLVKEIDSWDLEMSLDHLSASLKEVESLRKLADDFNNDPPTIYFSTEPSILVSIDGDPITKKDDSTGIEYVVNTPFFIAKSPSSPEYFINGGSFWYSAPDPKSQFHEASIIPEDIKAFASSQQEDEEKDSISESAEAPEIIVVTSPSELVQCDGEPKFVPIEGTDLLYVDNSENDLIKDINTQWTYLLLGGRWFYAKSLSDPEWSYIKASELPPYFKDIPEDSPMASVRYSIPGTDEAEGAVLEQSIPQTATVSRSKSTLEVKYDGDPQFKEIEGTEMFYAINTDASVIKEEPYFYCVDDGVWFLSDKATGPWVVAAHRPNDIDKVPADCPVYNLKFVYIYESTSDEVTVGYTPGYTESYTSSDGVVVYGTGYYYDPWYGTYYYPRPSTWGFGVHWNPWTGWGFSFGYSRGWVRWGFHPYHRRLWGPMGYHPGYRHGFVHGYRRSAVHHHHRRAAHHHRRNVYHHRRNGVQRTNYQRKQSAHHRNNQARHSNRNNNMYADRGGNVYQRNNRGGYQNRSTGQQANRQQSQQMNRSYQGRSQGSHNYQRSQSMNRGGYGGGGRGRGGGRR